MTFFFISIGGIAFGMQSSLNKHYRNKHEGIKYPCHICNKQINSRASLQNHIKVVHEGLRVHECKYCNKLFGKKDNLKVHMTSCHKQISNVGQV